MIKRQVRRSMNELNDCKLKEVHEKIKAFYIISEIPVQVVDRHGNMVFDAGYENITTKHTLDRCDYRGINAMFEKNGDNFIKIVRLSNKMVYMAIGIWINETYMGFAICEPIIEIESTNDNDVGIINKRILNIHYYGKVLSSLLKCMSCFEEIRFSEEIRACEERFDHYDEFTELGVNDMFEVMDEFHYHVGTGNLEKVRSFLSSLSHLRMPDVYNDTLKSVKLFSSNFAYLLFKTAIKAGVNAQHIRPMYRQDMIRIDRSQNIEACMAYMKKAAIRYTRLVSNLTASKHNASINKAVIYMMHNLEKQISLEEIASHVGLSEKYFSGLFKEKTGKTMKQFLTDKRVEKAKHLLANSNNSILEIAMGTGFSDQSYFTKKFKENMGMTPNSFRKKNKRI